MNAMKHTFLYKTYKIISLVSLVVVLTTGNLFFVNAQAWASTHQIAFFQGNKPGAVSFTFDDGYWSQVNSGAAQLEARGLNGTFFVVTGSSWIYDNVPWATWQNLANRGHEIGSHSVTHPYFTSLAEVDLRNELSVSRDAVNQNISGQSCISIAYPYAYSNAFVRSITSEYYDVARGASADEGGYLNYYGSGSGPFGSYSPINFYEIGSKQMDGLDSSDTDFNARLDWAVQSNAWFTLMFHSIPDAAVFGSIIDQVQVRQAFWIDTVCNVARYMKERMNSTIQVVADTSSEIRLRVVMDASLPTSVYNVPLTIRSTVPTLWTQVVVQQGSVNQILTPMIEGGEKVIYYNAIPNGGDIILTSPGVISNPLPSLTSINPSSTYVGGSAFTLTVTGTNFVGSSTVRWNGSDRPTTYVSATQLTASISASEITSIGTASVSVFNPSPGGGLSNQLPFSIKAKPITITVDTGQSKVFGDPDPVLTYTSSDPAATFLGSLNRTPGEAAGEYMIDQGTLTVVGGNYVITSFVPAEFSIVPIMATVTLSDLAYQYDGTRKSVTVITNPPGLPVNITYDGSPTPPARAGNYVVAVTVDEPNYTGGNTGTLTISRLVVDPCIAASSKVYDGTSNANITNRCLIGVLVGDDVFLSGGTATFIDKTVGSDKSVTANGLMLSGADADNYQLASNSAAALADILPRALNITAEGVNKVYDGTTNAVVTLLDDRVSGDNLTIGYVTASFWDPNVGSNKTIGVSGIYFVSGVDMNNYSLANTAALATANISSAGQRITVTRHAPATAVEGSSFEVSAIADSGLLVAITTSGDCSGQGNSIATITMTGGAGVCLIAYNQAGNVNFGSADTISETVTATQMPSITSADQIVFDIGFMGAFTITTIGNSANPMTISINGTLPQGVTFVDNGNGIASLSGIAMETGMYMFTIIADNGLPPQAEQSFTLTVRNGAIISENGIGSFPDTGDGEIIENEVILDTLGITEITVEFNQDVNNPPLDVDPKDVTNSANYMLVLGSSTGVFQTQSCRGGVIAPDVPISINRVEYENGGGVGPFIATLSINDGLHLNVTGHYRLFVCGTTSIVDATNVDLELAGDGINSGTDFIRNFRIQAHASGGQVSTTASQIEINALNIPVTGFAPGQITKLPPQPANVVYDLLGELRLEIPTLGIKLPIVGARIEKNGWNLTWLTNSVAYLEGSAYPTLTGNTVLTAHLTDANNHPGPFYGLKGMQVGQKIYIHVNGYIYVYQVQENRKVDAANISAVFAHEDYDWITLVTCEDFNGLTGSYTNRRIVKAILISIISENN